MVCWRHLVEVKRLFGHFTRMPQDFLDIGLQASVLHPDNTTLRIAPLLARLDGKRS